MATAQNDLIKLIEETEDPSASLPESVYAPSRFAMRLSNQAIKSSLSRFASQMCGLSRYIDASKNFEANMEYQRARHESEFLMQQLDRVAQQFPNMPELQNQVAILKRYDLALNSINLESQRAYENLQALRSSYINSIKNIQTYVEQLYLSMDDE